MHHTYITQISFPEINLATRDAHKLRGFFGNYFKDHSPLLHNHLENNKLSYAYPLVQYKILNNTPYLIGLNEGAELLRDLFLQIEKINIEGEEYPIYTKNIDFHKVEIGIPNELYIYDFQTLWMALNEENYRLYASYPPERQRNQLEGILKRNLSNALKGLDFQITPETNAILAKINTCQAVETRFKGNTMLGFKAQFVSNVLLPDNIGVGKSVSRGFGVLKQLK